MRSMLNFSPSFTTAEAFADFGSGLPPTGGLTEQVITRLAGALPPVPEPPSSLPTNVPKNRSRAGADHG